ncbi:MAG: aminotransferase class V-fold PLP-dependent enzyme [Pseudomonadota bacterium]
MTDHALGTRPIGRRALLRAGAALAATVALPMARGGADGAAVQPWSSRPLAALPLAPAKVSPRELAMDEAFWAQVGTRFDRTAGVTNLEHGYWGRMANPVRERYVEGVAMVDRQSAFYARKDYGADHRYAVEQIAATLGAQPDEIAITRNATESIHNLLRQHRGLAAGDTILIADADYPAFKRFIGGFAAQRGLRVVALTLPERANLAQVEALYREAMAREKRLKLVLLTDVSNQHGLRVPVAAITAAARERGADVICDAAQSWGLVDLRVDDLGVDLAAFNLHKWMGAPLGTGVLYIRRGSLDRIAPYPGDSDDGPNRIARRVHSGTGNFAAVLAIPAALEFHNALGGANKEARLRYLRSLWTEPAQAMNHVEVLGGTEESAWSGLGSFRLAGRTSRKDVMALQQRLEQQHRIFTVARYGLDGGACIRITPQVYTARTEVERLVDALDALRTA